MRKLLRILPDAWYISLVYFKHFRKFPNLKEPKTFNEKLQWLKLHDRKPEYTTMVDKYLVKQYIADKVGQEYVIPTLGVWETVDQIDFDALPNQFVLKWNHDSGSVVICKDKNTLDRTAAIEKLRKKQNTNGFWYGREWPYKYVKRCIIAEKYMEDDSGTELRDYKVLCFNGEPKLIQYHQGRFRNHTQDYYDVDWNRQEFTQGCALAEKLAPKPLFLEEMLQLSRKLSAGIPHVRVDWYFAQGQLYFGELTFFDASGFDGFEPEKWDEIIGSWIKLP